MITHPAHGSTYATGESILIQWEYNEAIADSSIRLDLFGEGSTNAMGLITTSVQMSTRQYLYIVPGHLATGTYWIAATSPDLTMIGYGPYPNNGTFGSQHISVQNTGIACTSHDNCSSTTYCDTNQICSVCDECYRWFDAVDYTCPQKCGGDVPFDIGSTIPAAPATEESTVGSINDYVVPGCPAFDLLVNSTNPLIEYAANSMSGIPRLMTRRLRDKLDLLAATVAGDLRMSGIKIRVRSGYKYPPADPADASLHHEGRALTIQVVNSSNPGSPVWDAGLLGRLGRLAAFAGIDWVEYANTDYVFVAVIPDGCNSPLDLVLLLDGSGSIEMTRLGGAPGNFVNRVLGFAKALIPHFTWGANANNSQLGIVTFSNGARVDFHLNEHHTAPALLAAIDQIGYPQGATHMSTGLNTARTEMFTEVNGMRNSTLGIPRVTIVLTDGRASNGYEPQTAASNLRGAPVNSHIVSIGVGTRYDSTELENMASSPVDQNVYTIKSFSRIPTIVDKISFTACQSRPIIDSGTDTSGQVSQCSFVFFRSQCGHLENSVVEVTSTTGMVHVYVGNTTSPGPFRYLYKDETNAVLKSVIVTRNPGDVSPLYIGVKGVATGTSTFSVRVWSNFFAGNTSVSANLPEDATPGTLVFEPVYTPGIYYHILSGNGEADPLFEIDSSTGRVFLRRSLDFESVNLYSLRISAQNNVLACQSGLLLLTVRVTDVNDVVPSFVGAPYSANLGATAPVGSEVTTVTAVDTDGAPLQYSIVQIGSSRRLRRQSSTFVINSASGVISTADVLNPNITVYSLEVTASDGQFSSTAALTVNVLGCQNCPPNTYFVSTCTSGSTTPVCESITPCEAGEFLVADATATSNRVCEVCPDGQFQELQAHTEMECTNYTNCTGEDIELTPPSRTADRICGPEDISSGDASSADSSSETTSWWPALLALLLIMVLLAALFVRQQRKVDNKDVEAPAGLNPLYGDNFIVTGASGAAALAPFAAGSEPIYALGNTDNPLWSNFRRCIAFDRLYYGNPPLALDDIALRQVYGILGLLAPPQDAIKPLRAIARRFFGTEIIGPVAQEHVTDDVEAFFWSAIVDDLVERAIDAIARHQQYSLAGTNELPIYDQSSAALDECFVNLNEDYVPADNEFLVPLKSDPSLRQLPPDANAASNIYDMGNVRAHAELNYTLASGDAQVSYSVANMPTSNEYAISKPGDDQNVYSLGTNPGVSTDDDDNIYTIASAPSVRTAKNVEGGSDAVYDMGGGSNGAVYDIGSHLAIMETNTDGDAVYDNQPQKLHASNADAVYDNTVGGARPESAVYDLGGAVGVISSKTRSVDRSSVIYDIGGATATCSSDDHMPYDEASVPASPSMTKPVYSIGSDHLGESTASPPSALKPQIYEQGGADTLQPAIYDAGGADGDQLDYDNLSSIHDSPESGPALYAIASEADRTVSLNRTRSYDNALETTGAGEA